MSKQSIRLMQDFYAANALEVAPLLLGKHLCRKISETGEIIKYRINETECYMGESDTACHAHRGKTPRTEMLYRRGGFAYVYLCYGIHSLLNVVTGDEGFPQAVLIRGIEGFNGPGKLTKHMGITRALNGEDLLTSQELWLEGDEFTVQYEATKRIGIDYATPEYKDKLWRFVSINN